MDRYGGDEQPVDDEVAFWRGFIAWWMREKAAPVPPRAWKALALAEARQCLVRRVESVGLRRSRHRVAARVTQRRDS